MGWAQSYVSIYSVLSDYSGVHLGRPGLGDKVSDSILEREVPLAAISASPPGTRRMLISSEHPPWKIRSSRRLGIELRFPRLTLFFACAT